MRKLVVIDLSSADTELFESYERKVIPLLDKHGGRLEISVRSVDGTTETHVLCFPDISHFDDFVSDPVRLSLKDELANSGASSTITDVEQIDYL